jgi:starch phosphorylase
MNRIGTTIDAEPSRGFVSLREGIESFLRFARGRLWREASQRERLHAVSVSVRRPSLDAMRESERRYREQDSKRLYYLSMEFLMGRALGNNLTNLGLYDIARTVVSDLGADLEELQSLEPDAALGNGGLGRLAACFLDSLATLDYPGFGYGINYEFGLFRQSFVDGRQIERPDHWLEGGSPWLIERSDDAVRIPVYGTISHKYDKSGAYVPEWVEWKELIGVPHDMPIVGHGGRTVNVLRLFTARASDEFDIGIFNSGDYIRAVQQKISTEAISKILYPSDAVASGRELRLLQEYFLVGCSVRDIIRRYKETHPGEPLDDLARKTAIQMNDTHPALTVAELMRVLVDEEEMAWEAAWGITVDTLGYTNHTLLPEALERWPIELLERVVPRHLQITGEINRRLLAEAERRFPGEPQMLQRISIIGDGDVRMANLAMAGSHSVNGVAALHSELVKTTLAPEYHRLFPDRFNNKTNGVTPRRWLLHANRPLAALITKSIGDDWVRDLDALRRLELLADDASLLERLAGVKRRNKVALAVLAKELTGISVDPLTLFDVQVKRIHEYKRQLLNALHIVHRYWEIMEGKTPLQPRTFFFAGKAAPGYFMAKLIIKLIHSIAEVVNAEPKTRDLLRVVFLPDYRVTLAEAIIPAAELSEQISTAGTEASGTGNMKLALNGALTIGTLDGANIEIRDEVGEENIFIFGLRTDEVRALLDGGYSPELYLGQHKHLRRVIDSLASGHFSRGDRDVFKPILAKLLSTRDEYVHLADLQPYIEKQAEVDVAYADRQQWLRKSLLNIARMGKFSSDRTIREYATDIWRIRPAVIGNFAHAALEE